MASTKDYYSDQTIVALTTAFVPQYFGFHARAIALYNDEAGGGGNVMWSFSGTQQGGMLKPGEQIVLDTLSNGLAVLSLKGTAGGEDYRLEVLGV